ncbi:MAG: thioredoxin-disulfide reductase [Candidatus Ancillula sp.]|jgi:thioredoxin reductase (NADPH)|nr:thioredoxin-disulfide reductase [Candidatus Ancillula sp.]
MKEVDVLILGSGPAGNTAAIYCSRAGLKPVVLAGLKMPGGSLTNTTDIENFPGFPEGIDGSELIDRQQEQAKKFGAVYEFDEVESVDFSGSKKILKTQMKEEYSASAVVIATGSLYKLLGAKGETEFAGRGVSYCATCDGFFFKGREVVVVGGGDTAFEEALYLANICSSVKLVHRREEFRASKIMVERAKKHNNIEFILNTVVEEILGEDELVNRVRLLDIKTGATREMQTAAVFVAIGSLPQTGFLGTALEKDDQGYIKLNNLNSQATNIPGAFAAGDCTDPTFRQAIIAAGAGARAGIEAERYLLD